MSRSLVKLFKIHEKAHEKAIVMPAIPKLLCFYPTEFLL
jgi:hypothetical protein